MVVITNLVYTTGDAHTTPFRKTGKKGFTCNSFCDGLFRMCESNVIDNKKTGDEMGVIAEQLLCIRVRTTCLRQCKGNQGLFKSLKLLK